MKALRLSKKLTPAKNIVHFLSVSALILSFSSISIATADELANVTRPLPDNQHDDIRCDNFTNAYHDKKNEFSKACTAAGLSSNAESCIESLEDCEGEDGKDDPTCINHSISMDEYEKKEEREDKIRESINKLQADVEDEIILSNEIKNRIGEANLKLKETFDEIANGRTSALEKEIAQMESITDNIAQKRDELDNLQLKFNQFIVDHEMECRKNAETRKTNYITTYRMAAAEGRLPKTHQGKLWNNAGLSINEQGTLRYNRFLKNCMALFTKNGARTGYGSQFTQQRKIINKQKSIIHRQMRNLSAQRIKVKRAKQNTLDRLNGLQKSAVAAHTQSIINLQNEMNASDAKKTRLLGDINQKQVKLGIAGSSSDSAAERIMLALGLMRQESSISTNDRAPASQKKYDAFVEALSLMTQVETARNEKNNRCPAAAEASNFVDKNLNAVATEVSGTESRGDACRRRNAASETSLAICPE